MTILYPLPRGEKGSGAQRSSLRRVRPLKISHQHILQRERRGAGQHDVDVQFVGVEGAVAVRVLVQVAVAVAFAVLTSSLYVIMLASQSRSPIASTTAVLPSEW